MRSIELPDYAATERLAGLMVEALPTDPGGWIVLLKGELGSGKSTIARAMLRAMGHTGSVPSPTYTLVEPYQFSGFSVYHIDLYRIKSSEELRFLGWTDLDAGLRLIEWPERVPGLKSQADALIELQYAEPGRMGVLSGLSDRGKQLISGLRFDALHLPS